MFCKKGAPRNFAKFTVKNLYQGLFFNKVAGLRPAILLKKRLWHRCFPVNFVKFLNTFIHRTPLVAASALLNLTVHSFITKNTSNGWLDFRHTSYIGITKTMKLCARFSFLIKLQACL